MAARQTGLEWWVRLSYRQAPDPGSPGAPRPLFAGLTGKEGAGGGSIYSGLRPEALRARACAHVCVCGGRGVEERASEAGACTRVHVAHTCVCLVRLAPACAFVCVLSPGECVSFRECMGTWRSCVLSVARGSCGHTSRGRCSLWLWAGLCIYGLNCVCVSGTCVHGAEVSLVSAA